MLEKASQLSEDEKYTHALKYYENILQIESDNVGVISSIIYGPDNRTSITSDTTDVMFTVYGPAGISTGQIKNHLEDISSYVKLVSSDAVTDILEIYSS